MVLNQSICSWEQKEGVVATHKRQSKVVFTNECASSRTMRNTAVYHVKQILNNVGTRYTCTGGHQAGEEEGGGGGQAIR